MTTSRLRRQLFIAFSFWLCVATGACVASEDNFKDEDTIILGTAEESPAGLASTGTEMYKVLIHVLHVFSGNKVKVGSEINQSPAVAKLLPYPNIVPGHDYLMILDGKEELRVRFACDTSITAREYAALSTPKGGSAKLSAAGLDLWSQIEKGQMIEADIEKALQQLLDVLSRKHPSMSEVYELLGQPTSRLRGDTVSYHSFCTPSFQLKGLTIVYMLKLTFDRDTMLARVQLDPMLEKIDNGQVGHLSVDSGTSKSLSLMEVDMVLRKAEE